MQEKLPMTARTFSATAVFLLAGALPAPQSPSAQEVVDLPGRDQRLDADFEEVFRIGVLEGEDWEMFGTVMHVEFDESGNLYIVDGSGGMSLGDGTRVLGMGSDGTRVLVFDASGNFLREFGTSGEGPGEFNMPAGFAVMRDGTTIVSDFGHRAYQLFDADGRFLRMVRGGSGRVAGNLVADPRGNAVFTGSFGRRIASISSGGVAAGPPNIPPDYPARPWRRGGASRHRCRGLASPARAGRYQAPREYRRLGGWQGAAGQCPECSYAAFRLRAAATGGGVAGRRHRLLRLVNLRPEGHPTGCGRSDEDHSAPHPARAGHAANRGGAS
ncbi:MAG: 6-bladed beta-propeller [Gemmatimonadetes bacterium]|nr:6-bladed beta-propeller [Gemmatimonadota bacterium]MYB98020.1 6-bladed beta-propeller [Gemmatimonadota bacterium]MYI46972.1 6-bladed beta-propeller [Gemmatimonadota bacterium]